MSQTSNVGGYSAEQMQALTKVIQEALGAIEGTGKTKIPGADETTKQMMALFSDSSLPKLEVPSMSLGGLSLETLLDAVGFKQRQVETQTGIANLKSRGEERTEKLKEHVEEVQKRVEEMKSKSILDGFLKAFKWIGMIAAAIASVAMIAVGAVTGGATAVIGCAMLALTISSVLEEATDGKVGFSPAFIVGKIMEATGCSDEAIAWTKMAVELATSIALIVASCGAGAVGSVGKAAGTAAQTATGVLKVSAETADKITKVSQIVTKASMMVNGLATVAKGATQVANAVNEKKIADTYVTQKELQAILERIQLANELDSQHIKEMMQRTQQTLETVSDIVQQSVETNIVVATGAPAMA